MVIIVGVILWYFKFSQCIIQCNKHFSANYSNTRVHYNLKTVPSSEFTNKLMMYLCKHCNCKIFAINNNLTALSEPRHSRRSRRREELKSHLCYTCKLCQPIADFISKNKRTNTVSEQTIEIWIPLQKEIDRGYYSFRKL